MINFINSIPDHIGWIAVGVVGCLCVQMFGLLIRTVVDMVRDRIEERKFITIYEEEE